jgi:hypothetical protein
MVAAVAAAAAIAAAAAGGTFDDAVCAEGGSPNDLARTCDPAPCGIMSDGSACMGLVCPGRGEDGSTMPLWHGEFVKLFAPEEHAVDEASKLTLEVLPTTLGPLFGVCWNNRPLPLLLE